MPKFQFSWIGTLTRLATGFCASFLSASALSDAAAGLSAGSGGLSCANEGAATSKSAHTSSKSLLCQLKRFPPACASFAGRRWMRSEEHTSELQSLAYLVCRLLLEKKK